MTPEDPRHGTYTGAVAHVREGEAPCPPCLEARRRYFRRNDKLRQMGRARPDRAPIGERNLSRLRDAHRLVGNYNTLGQQIGVAGSTVFQWVKMSPDTLVSVKSLQKLDAWTPRRAATHIGCVRRVQALIWNGYTVANLAPRIGVTQEALRDALNNGNRGENRWAVFHNRVRDSIVTTFDDLWDKPVYDIGSGAMRAARVRAHRRAIANNWCPPAAWDDIDDPNAVPQIGRDAGPHNDEVDEVVVLRLLAGERLPQSTRAEKDEAMRRWKRAGRPEAELCRIHGWKDSRYGREDAA